MVSNGNFDIGGGHESVSSSTSASDPSRYLMGITDDRGIVDMVVVPNRSCVRYVVVEFAAMEDRCGTDFRCGAGLDSLAIAQA